MLIEDKRFEDETVDCTGKEFRHCVFVDCILTGEWIGFGGCAILEKGHANSAQYLDKLTRMSIREAFAATSAELRESPPVNEFEPSPHKSNIGWIVLDKTMPKYAFENRLA